jgi:hypothetical protein
MGPEQNKDVAQETGTPPTPEKVVAATATAKNEGFLAKLRNMFNRATNVSPADALAGTTAGQVFPEVAQGMAAEARKSEQPVLPPPAAVIK